jgi:hypothetical protein
MVHAAIIKAGEDTEENAAVDEMEAGAEEHAVAGEAEVDADAE